MRRFIEAKMAGQDVQVNFSSPLEKNEYIPFAIWRNPPNKKKGFSDLIFGLVEKRSQDKAKIEKEVMKGRKLGKFDFAEKDEEALEDEEMVKFLKYLECLLIDR